MKEKNERKGRKGKKKRKGDRGVEERGYWGGQDLILITLDRHEFFSVFQHLQKDKQRKHRHSLKLAKKRRESSKRNYYIIFPRVIIKAIIIINQTKIFVWYKRYIIWTNASHTTVTTRVVSIQMYLWTFGRYVAQGWISPPPDKALFRRPELVLPRDPPPLVLYMYIYTFALIGDKLPTSGFRRRAT